MQDTKIPVCSKCLKKCNYESEEGEDDNGWYLMDYSNCCNNEVFFYDNIKEVILLNLGE